MKTIHEWLQELPEMFEGKECRRLALLNHENEKDESFLFFRNDSPVNTLSDAVRLAFLWGASEEYLPYWESVYYASINGFPVQSPSLQVDEINWEEKYNQAADEAHRLAEEEAAKNELNASLKSEVERLTKERDTAIELLKRIRDGINVPEFLEEIEQLIK